MGFNIIIIFKKQIIHNKKSILKSYMGSKKYSRVNHRLRHCTEGSCLRSRNCNNDHNICILKYNHNMSCMMLLQRGTKLGHSSIRSSTGIYHHLPSDHDFFADAHTLFYFFPLSDFDFHQILSSSLCPY